MALNEWFAKGMSPGTYMEQMTKHKENLHYIYERFSVTDDERLTTLKQKNDRVIVLTEDWCGDAMLNVPILFHIAEQANMDVSLLLRDSNLELMDQYLTNGKSRSIPIFIFIDQDGNEVTTWGPRAPEMQAKVEELFKALPAKDDPDYEQKWKETIATMTEMLRDDENNWHTVYESIINTLERAEKMPS
ncbi:thioredoxin family protein [Natribacillus halophilus]|uniref:Thioredoxin n=1 Tax=Natribacillus halophilus TaxID=549003 RepID=A0A1G8Q1J6_9BACI|nr:thioredoxin family protein [Natribacillus halophilus]SDI98587.1 Thioredoxin [Natribacillus halophilus]